MSFDKIIRSDVIRKKKEIEVGEYKFYANELNFPERLALSVSQNISEQFTALVINSITDQEGKHMTSEQALNLPDDVFDKFLGAALELNKVEQSEKN